MNKREYIKNLTPGTAFRMTGSATTYTATRVLVGAQGEGTRVEYTVPGDIHPIASTFTRPSLTLVTLV